MDKYTSADYQRAVGQFVSREVIYCVSGLISDLAQNTESEYYDDILSVCVSDDWLEPALEYVPDLDRDECVEILDSLCIECGDDDVSTLRDAVGANLQDGTLDPQEFCDQFNIEPYQREAFEHWIVSSWLAAKLEEHGEMVSRDIHGLTVWGRTTTGQSILLDRVICDIYDELHKDD